MVRFRLTPWPPVLGLLALVAPGLAETNDLGTASALQQSYDRCQSRIMVRVISRTDRASLDYAAYDRNPLFHYPMPEPPAAPPAVPELEALDFGGALVAGSTRDRVTETPLTEAELAQPLAWPPLLKYLSEWNYDAAEPLLVIGSQVSSGKWGNNDLVRPLQQISTAYLHGDEMWVKVEFRPELSWLPIDDEDRDAYLEIYGRIDPGQHAAELLEQIRTDYLIEQLPREEVETYFFELASDWYQALQTVTLEPETTRPWPNDETEPETVEVLDGKSFAEPFAVMRGKPYGEVIYSVFLLGEGATQAAQPPARRVAQAGNVELAPNPWQDEPQAWGGSWEAWCERLAAFHADVRRQLQARPAELKGLIGRDGFLFFRGDVEYLVSGDLRDQPDGRDPYPAIVDLNEQLKARDIDLLLVIIPTKAEVFPEKLSEHAPDGARPYVAPYCRKLLGELAEAGVEMVDLLPAFIEQREVEGQLLYMPQDTHWMPRGVELAAKLIAERVRQYPWYAALGGQQVSYSVRDAAFTRQGDICDMLTDQEKLAYRPLKLTAQQVVAPDGELYVDDPDSPICMLGDSFTGVFHFEDCQHAGLSAHLARELGVPIDLIMAQGSGPRIRGQLARRGHDAIEAKRLIVWTVVARDLYNYWAPWDTIKLP
jgi:hypothetical protein